MKVKALVSFAGVVTMGVGEEADIKDKTILDDLLRAGYVKALETPKAEIKEEVVSESVEAPEKPKRKRK